MPTTSLVNFQMTRSFDGDIAGTASDDAFETTTDSIWGQQFELNHLFHTIGLMLTQEPADVTSEPKPLLYSDWNPITSGVQAGRTCQLLGRLGYQGADYVGRLHTYMGELKPNQTMTVIYRYRRF